MKQKLSFSSILPKFRKLCLLTVLLGLLGLAIVLGTSLHVKTKTQNRILSAGDVIPTDVDCILVLGAGLRGNGTPSTILADRLDVAISLYHSGASDRLLMSGDHSRKDYDEVSAMRDYATERNVPKEHIFLDHAGFSTYESVYRARDIFTAKRVLIVTQSYHLYRALYIADALGLEAYGVASDARTYSRQPYYTMRELAARCKDFFFVIGQPQPTYLGDVIPISGDGTITGALPFHPLV